VKAKKEDSKAVFENIILINNRNLIAIKGGGD